MIGSDSRRFIAYEPIALLGAVLVIAGAAALVASPGVAAAAPEAAVRPAVSAVSPAAGRTTGGNTVTIAGRDLDSATAVYFAATKASHLVHVSSTRLTVEVPANGVRTVHVRVAGPGGRSPEVNGDRYTYVANAPRQVWTTPATSDAQHHVNDLSCASVKSCTVVDTAGYAVRFDGRRWSDRQQIDKGRDLIRVDCPGIHFCMAIDTQNGSGDTHYALSKVNDRWLTTRTPLTTDDINELSCSSLRLCVLTTAAGHAFVYRDGTWGAGTTIDTVSVNGVSCPDDNFCLAVDDAGDEVVFNGASWSAPKSTGTDDGEFDPDLYGVSCVDRHYCVSGAVEVIARRNGLWAPTGLNARHVNGFSCTTPLFCFVVGYNDETASMKFFMAGAAAVHTAEPLEATYDFPVVDCPSTGHCVAVLDRQYSVSSPRS